MKKVSLKGFCEMLCLETITVKSWGVDSILFGFIKACIKIACLTFFLDHVVVQVLGIESQH
jgi:hypothetical protein